MTMTDETTVKLFDLIGEEYRWPRPGDRLFAPSGSLSDAEIQSNGDTRFAFMTAGYKTAGDRLIEIAEHDRQARHDLIYPILFCYRQFLELSLKRMLSEYACLAEIEMHPPRGKEHSLKQLLEAFRRLLQEVYDGQDHATITTVSECILEFEDMDPHSFTFRYATDRKTGLPYPVQVDRIDLARLKDVMNGIGGFFDGCEGYLDELSNAQPLYE